MDELVDHCITNDR